MTSVKNRVISLYNNARELMHQYSYCAHQFDGVQASHQYHAECFILLHRIKMGGLRRSCLIQKNFEPSVAKRQLRKGDSNYVVHKLGFLSLGNVRT